MVQQLERYLNPLDEWPARNFKTEEVIEENIIKDLMSSSNLCENLLLEFINKHLLLSKKSVDLFFLLKNTKLETGLKKNKQTTKVINALKEDKQAFGLFVGKTNVIISLPILYVIINVIFLIFLFLVKLAFCSKFTASLLIIP